MASVEDPSLSLEEKTDIPEGTLTLASQDGKPFPDLDKQHVLTSEFVRNALAGDPTADRIDILGVGAVALAKVVAYLQHHQGHKPPAIAAPLHSADLGTLTNDFDATFITDCASETLVFDVINAANYMIIPRLLELGIAKVASLLKGKTLPEMLDVLTSLTGRTSSLLFRSELSVSGFLSM